MLLHWRVEVTTDTLTGPKDQGTRGLVYQKVATEIDIHAYFKSPRSLEIIYINLLIRACFSIFIRPKQTYLMPTRRFF